MLINHSDRVLGDPDALYCKSRGGGTSATLDQTGRPVPQTDGPAVSSTHVPQPISGGFGGPAVSRKQGFDSGSQDLPVDPGSSRQHWQALQSITALPSAAIRQKQKPTY